MPAAAMAAQTRTHTVASDEMISELLMSSVLVAMKVSEPNWPSISICWRKLVDSRSCRQRQCLPAACDDPTAGCCAIGISHMLQQCSARQLCLQRRPKRSRRGNCRLAFADLSLTARMMGETIQMALAYSTGRSIRQPLAVPYTRYWPHSELNTSQARAMAPHLLEVGLCNGATRNVGIACARQVYQHSTRRQHLHSTAW